LLTIFLNRNAQNSREEWEKKQLSTKERALQLAELLGLDAADTEEAKLRAEKKKKKDEGSFLEGMKLKVVNNIQIFVDNVHIRYEDDVSNPEQPFSFGITLEKFHVQSTDGNWKPSFFKGKQDVNYKLITLKNLAVYWDTPSDGRVALVDADTRSDVYVQEAMDRLIYKDSQTNPPVHQYLVKPVRCMPAFLAVQLLLNTFTRLDIWYIESFDLWSWTGAQTRCPSDRP
jgi:vacuolar protein sorting-associated protein 13A/C